MVAGLLGEQVDDFVSGGEAVTNAGGHRVRFGPHDGVAEDPAILLQQSGDTFGSEQEALGWRTLARVHRIGVAEVQPERTGWDEDTVDLAGHGPESSGPVVDVVLQPQLPTVAVVTQAEIRRAGQAHVDARALKRLEGNEGIAHQDAVE